MQQQTAVAPIQSAEGTAGTIPSSMFGESTDQSSPFGDAFATNQFGIGSGQEQSDPREDTPYFAASN